MTITRLFGTAATGLAVIAGAVSNDLVIRDFDDPGIFDAWLEMHPGLAQTLPVAQTKRAGHVYFRGPGGYFELDDGEYRGDAKHYVVAPPSVHPDGGVYKWLNPPAGEIPWIADPVRVGLLPQACGNRLRFTPPQLPPATHCVSHVCLSLVGTDQNIQNHVAELIVSTMPSQEGERNRCLFRLASRLRIIPGIALDEEQRRMILKEWHRLALPVIGTKELFVSWTDFETAWERLATGQAWSLEMAARTAPPCAIAKNYRLPEMKMLVNLCAALQRKAGETPFFLSCRDAGRSIGTDHHRAHRLLRRLKYDGVLIETRKGTQGTRGRATEWMLAPSTPGNQQRC